MVRRSISYERVVIVPEVLRAECDGPQSRRETVRCSEPRRLMSLTKSFTTNEVDPMALSFLVSALRILPGDNLPQHTARQQFRDSWLDADWTVCHVFVWCGGPIAMWIWHCSEKRKNKIKFQTHEDFRATNFGKFFMTYGSWGGNVLNDRYGVILGDLNNTYVRQWMVVFPPSIYAFALSPRFTETAMACQNSKHGYWFANALLTACYLDAEVFSLFKFVRHGFLSSSHRLCVCAGVRTVR